MKSSGHKNHLCKTWVQSRDKANYLKYLGIYKKLLKQAESTYYHEAFDTRLNNSKLLWKNINNLCCRDTPNINKPRSISKIIINNTTISDPKYIANEFNNFFVVSERTWLRKYPQQLMHRIFEIYASLNLKLFCMSSYIMY